MNEKLDWEEIDKDFEEFKTVLSKGLKMSIYQVGYIIDGEGTIIGYFSTLELAFNFLEAQGIKGDKMKSGSEGYWYETNYYIQTIPVGMK